MSDPFDTKPLSGFGVAIDVLARLVGEWPDDAVVYRLEAINDRQVLLEGAVPTGVNKRGYPTWKKRAETYRAVASVADYRRACMAERNR